MVLHFHAFGLGEHSGRGQTAYQPVQHRREGRFVEQVGPVPVHAPAGRGGQQDGGAARGLEGVRTGAFGEIGGAEARALGA